MEPISKEGIPKQGCDLQGRLSHKEYPEGKRVAKCYKWWWQHWYDVIEPSLRGLLADAAGDIVSTMKISRWYRRAYPTIVTNNNYGSMDIW